MSQKYILDTNAYFNYLRVSQSDIPDAAQFTDVLSKIKEGNPCVSIITKVEIISVLGKYARGQNGGPQDCNCIISETGEKCTNKRYITPRRRWPTKKIKFWRKLIKETIDGTSTLISLQLLPFDTNTINEAQKIIEHALIHNFGSMDAIIAATAQLEIANQNNVTVITSDKALKACLSKCSIHCWDAFAKEEL